MAKNSVARLEELADPLDTLRSALSEAKAAQWTLAQIEWGKLSGGLPDDHEGWLRMWALDGLEKALGEIERAAIRMKRPPALSVVAPKDSA